MAWTARTYQRHLTHAQRSVLLGGGRYEDAWRGKTDMGRKSGPYVACFLDMTFDDVAHVSPLSIRRPKTEVYCCTLLLYGYETGQLRHSKLAFDLRWS